MTRLSRQPAGERAPGREGWGEKGMGGGREGDKRADGMRGGHNGGGGGDCFEAGAPSSARAKVLRRRGCKCQTTFHPFIGGGSEGGFVF